ncbi:MAG: FG-GAP repeat protein [Tahibacter sp.]
MRGIDSCTGIGWLISLCLAAGAVSAAGPATDFSALILKGSSALPAEAGATSISSLAAGDFNCDGAADLAVGDADSTVSGHPDAGSVTVGFGNRLIALRTGGVRFNQDDGGVAGAAEDDDGFGRTLASGDMDHDGCADLIVGIPDEAVGSPSLIDAGGVGVFFGTVNGLDLTDDLFLPLSGEASPHGPVASDRKGTGLAVIDSFTSASSLPMLAIGAPGFGDFPVASHGGVSVRRSNSSGGGLSALVTYILRSNVASQGNQVLDEVGSVIASGDFNNDGHGDIAISGNNLDGGQHSEGHVIIAYGADTNAGLTYERITQGSSGVAGGPEEDDQFGSAMAVGDFDDDGYDDLALGTASEDIGSVFNAGSVTVLFGSGAGLLANAGSSITFDEGDFTGLAIEGSDEFGGTLAAGDINRDGYDDLVIGAPSEDVGSTTNAGMVLFVPGGPNGPVPSAAAKIFDLTTSGMPGSPASFDRFGDSLAVADFNDDGVDDIAIGMPGRKDASGTVKGAVMMLFSVSDTTTRIVSVDPPLGVIGSAYAVKVSSARNPIVGVPIGRGQVNVTTSTGDSCQATIATNGLGTCTIIPGAAGTITLNASTIAQIGFRASTATPVTYKILASNDRIFANGFE